MVSKNYRDELTGVLGRLTPSAPEDVDESRDASLASAVRVNDTAHESLRKKRFNTYEIKRHVFRELDWRAESGESGGAYNKITPVRSDKKTDLYTNSSSCQEVYYTPYELEVPEYDSWRVNNPDNTGCELAPGYVPHIYMTEGTEITIPFPPPAKGTPPYKYDIENTEIYNDFVIDLATLQATGGSNIPAVYDGSTTGSYTHYANFVVKDAAGAIDHRRFSLTVVRTEAESLNSKKKEINLTLSTPVVFKTGSEEQTISVGSLFILEAPEGVSFTTELTAELSSTAPMSPAPERPTATIEQLSTGNLKVTWVGSRDDLSRPSSTTVWEINVYAAGKVYKAEVPLPRTNYTFDPYASNTLNLPPQDPVEVSVVVRTTHNDGTEPGHWSQGVSVQTQHIFLPYRPTIRSVAKVGNKVKVTWLSPTDSTIRRWEYRIKRQSETVWQSWTTVPSSVYNTSSMLVTIPSGVSYDFQVRAVNPAGIGRHSNTVILRR